jgi:catechol 2,3-dioxygenase-like lactoylglutathione lyase family enzyme
MSWTIHRVGLVAQDLAAATAFFGTQLGLGAPRALDADRLAFGPGSRGLRVTRPSPMLARDGRTVLGAVAGRHVAIEVADLAGLTGRLTRAGLPCLPATAEEFETPAVWTRDPAGNLVAFCQAGPPAPAWGWEIHHVNLQAGDVRAAVEFYTAIAGLPEGSWEAPAARGSFSIDPAELAVIDAGGANRGLHLIRPDAGFALRNGFAHNPSIGGHPAFCVPDVLAVRRRLEAAGVTVSDAGVYAMAGMHQIYVQDPEANMIEVNQHV